MSLMQVILAESIPNLGDEGDVVNVKGGYARNYLIPKGFAFAATSANAALIAHKKKQLQDQRRRKIKTEQDLARRLSEIRINIPVKVGEEDRIFGSVTSRDIANALSEKGYEVDRRKIILKEPIKALGVYTVPVHFSESTEAQLKVWVVKENE